MDIKLKKYSQSRAVRFAAFVIAVLCFSGIISTFYNIGVTQELSFSTAFEDSYYQSQDCQQDYTNIISNLFYINQQYVSEQYIQSGATLDKQKLAEEENQLFRDFVENSRSYNPNLTEVENYQVFKEVYANEIANIKTNLIKKDLMNYRAILRNLDSNKGVFYLAQTEYGQVTNSDIKFKEYFKSFPSYVVLDSTEYNVYAPEIKNGDRISRITSQAYQLGPEDAIYVAFTPDYLNSRVAQWSQDKAIVINGLYRVAGLSLIFALAFMFLILATGKKSEDQGAAEPCFVDRIYNDIKIILCIVLLCMWFALLNERSLYPYWGMVFSLTFVLFTPGLTLFLSMVRHFKNKTFLKHTAIYTVFYKIFSFVRDVYNNGSLAVKILLIVIVYPVLAALTFFMFPITLGLAAWLALKRVKEFKAISEGVKLVKDGDIGHKIDVPGDGEFARLASDINSITDGLGKAVENGIKSERLKSELISNVSHDIRTPLTSIITYIDLLKNEKDPARVEEYIEVIDQKAQRLKLLTDDLFEAAKATSGSIPVCLENIEIVSLLKQGLGEMDDKIQERRLEFKLNYGQDKLNVKADGKLLWRAIENLFSNILKYALEGSRVYIDVIDLGNSAQVVIKNISAYELNISAEELMERFARGDESRSSQGSGLGLSIARSLLEIQQGSLNIEVDGDLFKAIIQIGKAE
ncbi:MAG: HAMP domain-containing sensor histidine kinase [Syntrophomonadaceae bacterium]